jgi:hypothetical protein
LPVFGRIACTFPGGRKMMPVANCNFATRKIAT